MIDARSSAPPLQAFVRGGLREISRGGQATVSVATGADGRGEVIVKRFRPAPGVEAALQDEVAALACLHDQVNGARLCGWTVLVPTVVAVCEQPPSLVLTRLPGEPMETLIRGGWTPPRELGEVLGEVFVRYWTARGRPLGDVNLANVLCSVATREVAIIDPGLPSPEFELPGEPGAFYPSSRDLGCLLHQVLSTNVLLTVWRRTAAATRLAFVRELIHGRLRATPDAAALADEVGRCAAAHLNRVCGGSLLERAWRRAVRGIAHRALVSEIDRMGKVATC